MVASTCGAGVVWCGKTRHRRRRPAEQEIDGTYPLQGPLQLRDVGLAGAGSRRRAGHAVLQARALRQRRIARALLQGRGGGLQMMGVRSKVLGRGHPWAHRTHVLPRHG